MIDKIHSGAAQLLGLKSKFAVLATWRSFKKSYPSQINQQFKNKTIVTNVIKYVSGLIVCCQ